MVECSSCGELVKTEYYVLYVGLGNEQFVCVKCQEKPFKEVMESLDKGKIFVAGTGGSVVV
ncbi:unnamed protein product [marine sediment metagenome]|uniref:Uncharacterized protein n=1 Tax=marine sediment metagenome TaxID=412755 RepID=X1LQR8_9ZZZZ